MKKTFFTLSLRKIIGEIALLSVVALIVIFLAFLQDWGSVSLLYEFIIELGISLIGIVIFLDCFLRIALYRIKFYEDRISVTGDGGVFNFPIVQHRLEVKYQEMVAVRIVVSPLNSNKTNPDPIPRPRVDHLFIEIETVRNKKIWICLSYFSKRQRREMIEIINEKTGSNYNYDTLWQEYQQEEKLKREERQKKRKTNKKVGS